MSVDRVRSRLAERGLIDPDSRAITEAGHAYCDELLASLKRARNDEVVDRKARSRKLNFRK